MGDTWSTRVIYLTGFGALPMLHMLHIQHQGERHTYVVELLPQDLILLGLSAA